MSAAAGTGTTRVASGVAGARDAASPRPAGPGAGSHARVVRAAAAFGGDPDDVLRRILDVAGLAVHAVLRVDLQPVSTVLVLHELVDAGRAVAALGAGVLGQVDVHRDRRVLQGQVDGLILGVV